MHRVSPRLALAIAAGAMCTVAPPEPPPPSVTRDEDGIAGPADIAALGENRTVLEDMIGLPLTTASLRGQPERAIAGHYTFFMLAVVCALTDEQSVSVTIDGETRTVHGRYRMAPQWADGPCDESCQEWVSGCMLAKINGYGVPVRIFFHTREDHPDRTGLETPDVYGYPVQEGAFFGNLFTSPPRMYSCRGSGRDPLYDTFRVCTHPGSPCKIQSVGPCMASPESPDEPHACEAIDDHRVLRRCHNRLTLAGTDTYPADSRSYDRLVTIHLIQSALSAGLSTDTCFDGPGPDTHPTRAVPVEVGAIGDACRTDDDCNGGDLYCDHLGGPGFCTRGCTNTGDEDEEAETCGDDGAVCMLGYDDWERCAQGCRADHAGGRGCPAAQVCTAYHLFVGFEEEETGCVPFCRTDEDCPGTFCHPRTGECELKPPARDGLADGEPCNVFTDECLGGCVPQGGSDGICGSYVNLGEDRFCPDPSVTPFAETDDDLALCTFKNCGDHAECTAPLVCSVDYGVCLYP